MLKSWADPAIIKRKRSPPPVNTVYPKLSVQQTVAITINTKKNQTQKTKVSMQNM